MRNTSEALVSNHLPSTSAFTAFLLITAECVLLESMQLTFYCSLWHILPQEDQ